MKLITIIDIPDKDYELSNQWRINIDGDIEYFDEKGNYWHTYYDMPIDHYYLKPLPEEREPYGYLDVGNEDGLYEQGYNAYRRKILGEQGYKTYWREFLGE